MKRRHRLSVSLGDPVLSRCNFAHSLSIMGLIDEAFEVALEASEHAPDDLFALNVLINAALAKRASTPRSAALEPVAETVVEQYNVPWLETLTRSQPPWTKPFSAKTASSGLFVSLATI